MKDTETDKNRAGKVQATRDLDEESVEVIKTVDRKKERSSENQCDEFRIWRCNGLPIGVHIHKKLP